MVDDGLQFCAVLDATLGPDRIAVVAMTASGQAEQFRAACHADDALGKPFDLDALAGVVNRHLAG